jgi:hypothetical protein
MAIRNVRIQGVKRQGQPSPANSETNKPEKEKRKEQ